MICSVSFFAEGLTAFCGIQKVLISLASCLIEIGGGVGVEEEVIPRSDV